MQTLARDGLTAAQVVALVESSVLRVSAGVELVDTAGAALDDISDDLLPGQSHVERGSYRQMHLSGRLRLSRELLWGAARVRPYVTLTGADGAMARFNLGVLLCDTPTTVAGENPTTWSVDCFDVLAVLADPRIATYQVADGEDVLATVEGLLDAAGLPHAVDQTASGTLLDGARTWPVDAGNTTLKICNELLRHVGYGALYTDPDGQVRSAPYIAPADRASEWTYDDGATSTWGARPSIVDDLWDTPNRWVFVRDNPAAGLPLDTDGIYVVTNQSDGPTSIDQRGRTVTAHHRYDVASQTALQSAGDRRVARDRHTSRKVEVAAGPNPAHWHFDTVTVDHPAAGLSGKWTVTDWSLPLSGRDMALTLTETNR